ncbi:MAG: penicillin-binding protein activator [Pseudomonadota bacterium]
MTRALSSIPSVTTRIAATAGRRGLGVPLRRLASLVAMLGIMGLAACSAQRDADAPVAEAPEAPVQQPVPSGPVPVALLVPLGAAQERVGNDARAITNAARMALEEGPADAITLNILDTGGTAEGARLAASRAVEQGAALILGPLFSASTSAVAPIARPTGAPVLSFSTDTTVAGSGVWVTGFTPEDEVQRILAFAARNGITRVGVYAPDIPYGQAALRAVEGAAARTGISVVARESYPRSFQDIERTSGAFAAMARSLGAEAVLLPDFSQGLQTAASFMAFHGVVQPEIRYLGTGQWEAGETLREQALVGGWFAGADPIAADAFAGRYRARFGSRPPFVAVLGYDAARVAIELAVQARTLGDATPYGPEALTQEAGFAGGVGALRLLPDGTAQRGIAVLEVGQGGFITREPAPTRFGAGS